MAPTPRKVAFITCAEDKLGFYYPTPDEPEFVPTEPPFVPDDQLVVDCLRSNGIEVSPVEWGVPLDQLTSFDVVVMRSPWDYADTAESRTRFVTWMHALKASSVNLHNEARFILWLLNKAYLLDFKQAGTPVVPTRLIEKNSPVDLQACLREHQQLVLKPCVSGSGLGLFYIPDETALAAQQAAIDEALAENDYVLQPFMPEIKTQGEWSLIYLEGRYSHAVHKMPGETSILVHAEHGGSTQHKEPPVVIIQTADGVMKALPKAHGDVHFSVPLYLRLDFIPTATGPVLSECEGVDPELFFRRKPESAQQFTQAIINRFL